eukprot:12137399-Heterocapsa_arctica.AAC.1
MRKGRGGSESRRPWRSGDWRDKGWMCWALSFFSLPSGNGGEHYASDWLFAPAGKGEGVPSRHVVHVEEDFVDVTCGGAALVDAAQSGRVVDEYNHVVALEEGAPGLEGDEDGDCLEGVILCLPGVQGRR